MDGVCACVTGGCVVILRLKCGSDGGGRYLSQQPEGSSPLFDTKAWVDDLSACDV